MSNKEKSKMKSVRKERPQDALRSIDLVPIPGGPQGGNGPSGDGYSHAVRLRESQKAWAEEQYRIQQAQIAAGNRSAQEHYMSPVDPEFLHLDEASTADATDYGLHSGDAPTKAGDEGHPEK
jgi:hypothetical protein